MTDKSPDAFRTISEVAGWLGVQTHVLRFWESRFSQIKPVKRAGGRRYYRPSDMALIGGIKVLLHDNGMTIRGVQKILREQGVKAVTKFSPDQDGSFEDTPMALDVMPADNVVVLKPAPAAKPALAQADLPLEATSAPEDEAEAEAEANVEAAPVDAAPAELAAEDAAGDNGDDAAQQKLIALRARLAALRERSAETT